MTLSEAGQDGVPHRKDAAVELEERVLWTRFRSASSREDLFASWLEVQCRFVEGAVAGLLLLKNETDGSFETASTWPHNAPVRRHLIKAAEKALSENRALAMKLDPQGVGAEAEKSRTVLGQVVHVAEQPVAAVVLELQPRAGETLERPLRILGWGTAWIELELQRGSSATRRSGQLDTLLDLVATPLEHDHFRAASIAFVTELATRLDCQRVSLGTVDRKRVRLSAVSHSAQFAERANLSRAIEAAMEEALDQEDSVVFPAEKDSIPQVTACHEALCAESGSGSLLSIPIAHGSRFCGVVTLERDVPQPFDPSTRQLVETVADLAGPMLDIQYRDDRWIGAKILDAARSTASRMVGPGNVALKLFGLVGGALVLFLTFVQGDYRVVADTVIEARVMRAAVAPFDAYIAEAPVRAGDRVKKGELLARLDDRDLRLQHARFSSEIAQLSKEMKQAMADHNAANVRILSARVDQVKAQLNLTASHLEKTQLVAPFDGIVVSGDLSQMLESPVQRGELLFEIAPEGEFRVVAEVDESEIDEIVVGLEGELVFSAFPTDPVPITVSKITPVSEAKEGRNVFRVEADLDRAPDRVQPGMEGVAKILVDQRRLIWVWGHDVSDWLRLALWRWTP